MTKNLRISLTILTVGFGIEGISELYSLLLPGAVHPGITFLFLFPIAVTVAGLAFLWIGQHEWNALHRERVRRAHLIFVISLLGAVVAGAIFAALWRYPSLGVPLWSRGLFGAAVGSLVLGTFVTYVLLVFHLVARPSQAILLASIGWALIVSALVGAAMAANLPTLLALATHRTLSVPSFVAPVDVLASYLFLSYFLLLAAYVDAHRTILRAHAGRAAPDARTQTGGPGSPGFGPG